MSKAIKNSKSETIRQSQLLLRNDYNSNNKWGIPCVKNNTVDIRTIKLMGFNNTKFKEDTNFDKTIHFFLDDIKLDKVYTNYERNLGKLAQYSNVITPDFSMYIDMPLALQIYSVFKNRWCGAYWQDMGLSVLPSVNWSDKKSFEFAFLGIEKGASVAVSMIGGKRCKEDFLLGYNEMLQRIEPQCILCYGKPFEEMQGKIIAVDYLETTGRRR